MEGWGKHPISKLITANPYNLYYNGLAARYYVKGGIRPQLDSMRISLQIIHPQTNDDYRTKLDLYEFKQVSSTSTAAAEKLGIRADLVEKDLSALTNFTGKLPGQRPTIQAIINRQ